MITGETSPRQCQSYGILLFKLFFFKKIPRYVKYIYFFTQKKFQARIQLDEIIFSSESKFCFLYTVSMVINVRLLDEKHGKKIRT